MQSELVENMTSAGKASYEAIQSLGVINSKTLQKLTDIQFGIASFGVESGVQQMKLLSESNSYEDFFTAGSDYASEYNDKIMEYARQTADVLSESKDEVSAWVKESMSVVAATETPVVKTKSTRARKTTKKAATKRVARKS